LSLPTEQKLFYLLIAPIPAGSGKTTSPRLLARLVRCYRATLSPDSTPSVRDEAKALDVSTESLRLWRVGDTLLSLDRMVRNLRRALRKAEAWAKDIPADCPEHAEVSDVLADLERFLELLGTNPPPRVYEMAALLGYRNKTEVQQTLDHYIYARRPLMNSTWLDFGPHRAGSRDPESYARRVVGHHVLYLRRDEGKTWLRAPTRVRYIVMNEHNQGFIRFKTAMPAADGGAHDLDGSVAVLEPYLYFSCESRVGPEQDQMFLICPLQRDLGTSRSPVSVGKYLTIDQHTNLIVADYFVLLQHSKPASDAPLVAEAASEEFMKTHRKLKPDSDEFMRVSNICRAWDSQPQADAKSRPGERAPAQRSRASR
jgi:hypothetical protein